VTAYASFESRNYRFLLASTVLSVLGQQMLAIVVGWDLYKATHSPVVLGNVGLVQIIPTLLFTFVAGHVADRYDRRRTAMFTQLAIGVIGFALAFAGPGRGVTLIYTCLFLTATANAFQWPVRSALLPQLVAPEHLTNAVSWQSTGRELATVTGPALAGFLLAWRGSEWVYASQALCSLLAAASTSAMQLAPRPLAERPVVGWRAVVEGLRFVWNEKVILSAISLDLLAVFFGGATALLPIYAQDILHTGATGLGWLRAAPAFGAGLMALAIAHRSHIRNAGVVLLASVMGFGVATIGFGIAKASWLSFVMLFGVGVFDEISVVLRVSLVQMRTPDHLRGRVSAVNGLFIACSNQWGAVESGLAAAWLGTVPSVVFGGAATIVVVAAIGALSASLRRWRN
jgi:MFS family permease